MPDAHESHNQTAHGVPPVPTQMVYAVHGSDRISGNDVETVIEAPNINAARRIADQKSLEVTDITLMHPLNGAEALATAQANPNDRYNQPGPVTQLSPATPSAAATSATEPPTPPAVPEPAVASAPAPITHRPTGFAGPAPTNTHPQRSALPGSVTTTLALACLGGLFYLFVVHNQPNGAFSEIFAASPHSAAAVVTTYEIDAGPTDVEEFIASCHAPTPVSVPILPRAQRGPGKTAYHTLITPTLQHPAATPERTPRAEAPEFLVLTSLSRGGKGKRAAAIINGQVLYPGQSIRDHSLVQILDDSVVLERNGRLLSLELTPTGPATSK